MKFHVPDMSCGHCVATIEKVLKAADPTATLRTDLDARTAEIGTTVSSDAISQVLATAGYPSTALEDSQSK